MRVLQVIAGAAVGGAETFAQDAILSLHGRGVEQLVLTRPWPAHPGLGARRPRRSGACLDVAR